MKSIFKYSNIKKIAVMLTIFIIAYFLYNSLNCNGNIQEGLSSQGTSIVVYVLMGVFLGIPIVYVLLTPILDYYNDKKNYPKPSRNPM
jgi:small neutral amino acid transporter SnatA (MarC family)